MAPIDLKDKRQPKDFNQMNPDRIITDPIRSQNESDGIAADVEYPKHVHRYAGLNLMHEYRVVNNASEEAAAKRDGFGSVQDANADAREAAQEKAPKAPKAGK